jgi:hypothetical protein
MESLTVDAVDGAADTVTLSTPTAGWLAVQQVFIKYEVEGPVPGAKYDEEEFWGDAQTSGTFSLVGDLLDAATVAAASAFIVYPTPDGDDDVATAGTQVDPIIDEDLQRCMGVVYYWAMVTDPQGLGDIREAAVDVLEPKDDGNGYEFKYKVELDQLHTTGEYPSWDIDFDAISADFHAADTAGLVTYASGYDLAEIEDELYQENVLLFRGKAIIEYHQAGGLYHVNAYAYDQGNAMADILENCFTYVRTEALTADFVTIPWGDVNVSIEKVFCGDAVMYENDADMDGYNDTTSAANLPTVKSCGNCSLDIAVEFSNLLRDSDDRPMDEVEFDAYLVHPDYREGNIQIDELRNISSHNGVDVEAPICTPTKIAFSIHVIQAPAGTYEGSVSVTGTDNARPWGGEYCGNSACPNNPL